MVHSTYEMSFSLDPALCRYNHHTRYVQYKDIFRIRHNKLLQEKGKQSTLFLSLWCIVYLCARGVDELSSVVSACGYEM